MLTFQTMKKDIHPNARKVLFKDITTYQNFIITLASGSNTLDAPTTEASQIGQTGVIVFIQPSIPVCKALERRR